MCLLLVTFRSMAGYALVIGANRDERYDRPATPVGVRGEHPRILAGRDEVAGGTWLAANVSGLVAGLTNQPSPGGRDPDKRSRGALPLMLAGHKRAVDAVDAFVSVVDPAIYNPCSIMVGDRDALYSLEVNGRSPVTVRSLPPGRYVLENRPFGERTAKVRSAQRHLDAVDGDPVPGLQAILSDHQPAAAELTEPDGRLPERTAACIHTEQYGTRSSMIVLVPTNAAASPRILETDGPPCTTPFRDVSALWGAAG